MSETPMSAALNPGGSNVATMDLQNRRKSLSFASTNFVQRISERGIPAGAVRIAIKTPRQLNIVMPTKIHRGKAK